MWYLTDELIYYWEGNIQFEAGSIGPRLAVLARGWQYWPEAGSIGPRLAVLARGWQYWPEAGSIGPRLAVLAQAQGGTIQKPRTEYFLILPDP